MPDDMTFLAAELRSRWQSGERVGIEALGEAFELIKDQEEQLLDILYHEVLIREEFGDEPQVEEFVARFPQLEEQLRRQFEVHSAVDQDWRGDGFEPDDPELRDQPDRPTLGGYGTGRTRSAGNIVAPPGYELLEELGRGGMAVVFKARQQNLNRLVALKMILGGHIATDQALARFRQEAQAVAQLQHPGIVQIHEVGEHQGLPFLSLEYVPGGTLQQLLIGGPLPNETAARLVESLARTMHFAHEQGIIHRDLKPANILVAASPAWHDPAVTLVEVPTNSSIDSSMPTPKISDFGLARLTNRDSELTTTGQVIGTPSYMAPEQARQSSETSGPAPDIYSLGAILYETLTGRPPFQGATILQTLEQLRDQEPVPPRQLQPSIPSDLETICLKCLEKSPNRRYASMLDLADDLGRYLRSESIMARPSGWVERSRKWMRRRPAVAALLALIAVLTAGGWAAILHEVRRANEAAFQATVSEAKARRDRDQTDEQRRIADLERQNAREAQARAETNFLHAIDVVRRVSQIGQQLRFEPLQQRNSSLLFDTALEFFENMLVERGDDPAIRYQAAGAFLKAGEIRMVLGQYDKAAKQFTHAIQLLDAPTDEPHRLSSLQDLASALRLQGNNSRLAGDLATAETSYRRCITIYESLTQRTPSELEPLIAQANARVNLCVILNDTDRHAESEKTYREALVLLRRANERSRNSTVSQMELALCLDDFGNLLRTLNRVSEAEPMVSEAYDIRKRLWDNDPNSRDYRVVLSRSLRSLARSDAASAQWDQAAGRLEEAIGLLLPVISAFPEQAEVRSETLAAIRAHMTVDQRRPESVAPDAALAVELHLLNVCFHFAPKDLTLATQIAHLAERFAERFWARDAKTDAISHYAHSMLHFKKALELRPDDASLLARSAWLHAICPAIELRDIPLAIRQGQRATSLNTNHPLAWLALGAAELRASNYLASEKALRRAIELTRSDMVTSLQARALLAQTLSHQSRDPEAEQELHTLSEQQPKVPASQQLIRLAAEARNARVKPTSTQTPADSLKN